MKRQTSLFISIIFLLFSFISLAQAINITKLIRKLQIGEVEVQTENAVVFQVAENSPASQLGIKKGDVIISINNENEFDYYEQISNAVSKNSNDVEVLIERDGKRIDYHFDLSQPSSHLTGGQTGIQLTKMISKKANIFQIMSNHLSYIYAGVNIPEVLDVYKVPFLLHNYFFTAVGIICIIIPFFILRIKQN